EFIKASDIDQKGKKHLTRITALIKSKQTPFDANLMKPAAVVEAVRARHPGFTMHTFVNAWKKLQVRPERNSHNPGETSEQYCYYDPVDNDYRYEPAFCDLIVRMLDEGETFSDAVPIR